MRRRAFLGAVGASLAGLAGCLGDPEYNLNDFSAESPDEPLSLSATLSGDSITIDNTAALKLSLENTTSEPIDVRSIPVWPFGVPTVRNQETDVMTPPEGVNASEYTVGPWASVHLRSPAFEKTDAVNFSVQSSHQVSLEPTTKQITPAETIEREFTIPGGSSVRNDGTWKLQGYNSTYLFEYDAGNGFEPFEPSVTFELSQKQLLPFL